MILLIKNATVVCRDKALNGKKFDLYIKNGIIEKIAKNISDQNAKTIEANNLHVSIGWMDIGTQVGEPGYEYRETLSSAADAAARGGFTTIAPFPNTNPCVDNKSSVQYILNNTQNLPVDFLPIAAVSQGCAGNDITEMMDLSNAGAIAFSDGKKPVQDGGLLLRALQYAKASSKKIIQRPVDSSLEYHGMIHEGKTSLSLGLSGMPSLSEYSSTARDIKIAEYAENEIVLHTISTKESADLVKTERKNNNQLSATVAYKNLIQIDEDLIDFNSNLKVQPPLRSSKDQKALVKGIKDGSIQAICSNHVPLEQEKKKLEFPFADFGAIGLETCYSALNTQLAEIVSTEILIDRLAYGPREILNLKIPELKIGSKANLTLFDPSQEWTYDRREIRSKSKNTPYIGVQFVGKVIGIINGKHYVTN